MVFCDLSFSVLLVKALGDVRGSEISTGYTTIKLQILIMCLWFTNSPKTVRAGTDSLLSQKETWDKMTVMKQGM